MGALAPCRYSVLSEDSSPEARRSDHRCAKPERRVDAREVTRRFRSDLWPPLKSRGFIRRTERVAWRDVGDSVDVIEVNFVGPLADAVGCSSYSFGAFVASLPAYLGPDRVRSDPDGKRRPHYWGVRAPHAALKDAASTVVSAFCVTCAEQPA